MDMMDKELEFYKKRIKRAEAKLKKLKLPRGEFKIARNGNYYRWRFTPADTKKSVDTRKSADAKSAKSRRLATSDRAVLDANSGKQRREEISKSNEDFAADLAFRMYLEKLIEDDRKEIKNIETFRRNHIEEPHGITDVKCREEFCRLLSLRIGEFTNKWDSVCEEWASEDYERYMDHPEELNCKTDCGIIVRSKSEAEIADQLFSMHIPFRYEPCMTINRSRYAPDFLIMHPVTHELYIWEHFGQLDDEGYLYNNKYKPFNYAAAGWYWGINFIVTGETQNHPFTGTMAKDVVIRYFG